MGRFLKIIGALALAATVATAFGVGVLVHDGQALDAESKAFVDRAVPAIAANWDRRELMDRASPELMAAAAGPGAMEEFFDRMSELGALTRYEGAKGEATIALLAGSDATVTATYTAKARFKNGAATFRVGLRKRDGHWMIQGFYVEPSSIGRRG